MRRTFPWISLIVVAIICLSPTLRAAEPTAAELIAEGQAALAVGRLDEAEKLAAKAIETDPKNAVGYFLRGVVHETQLDHPAAITDYNRALELDPKLSAVYDRRGSEQFRLNHIAESIQDFDKFLELVPEQRPQHWKRGISYYYAGRFQEGAKQFEAYQTVDDNDVENAVWRFICQARTEGIAAARKSLLKIKHDTRVPMMQVYALFAGEAKPADVMAAAEAGDPTPAQLQDRLFFAHLYLGLYAEASGDEKGMREHILLAAEKYYAPQYMGDVARVHLKQRTPPLATETRKVSIVSEGVRLSGELFWRKRADDQPLPVVVLCHGWGGIAANLHRQAEDFAAAGYLAVIFDYRGWGASDGRVILSGASARPTAGQPWTPQVTEIREVVDPFEQTDDIFNVIHWLQGEPLADKERFALWGTSYAGGHVVYVAARDRRVKCLVSQVGAFDSRWIGRTPEMREATYKAATERARGVSGYPPPGARVIGNLRGAPIRDKLLRYAPIESVAGIRGCAMLFIVAEKEELLRNADNARLAYERASEPKKYVEIPAIAHYGIYAEAREEATRLAIQWLDEHLKPAASATP